MRVKFIKNKEDINEIKIDDSILVKYKDGKMFQVKIIRIEKDILIGKSIMSNIQEIFINKNSLLNNYIEQIILEKNIKSQYTTRLNKVIKDMTFETKNLIKAHMSKLFCDNKSMEIDIKILTTEIIKMNYEKLLLEMRNYKWDNHYQ